MKDMENEYEYNIFYSPMVVVGLDVAMFEVVVVLGAVCEIVVPKINE